MRQKQYYEYTLCVVSRKLAAGEWFEEHLGLFEEHLGLFEEHLRIVR